MTSSLISQPFSRRVLNSGVPVSEQVNPLINDFDHFLQETLAALSGLRAEISDLRSNVGLTRKGVHQLNSRLDEQLEGASHLRERSEALKERWEKREREMVVFDQHLASAAHQLMVVIANRSLMEKRNIAIRALQEGRVVRGTQASVDREIGLIVGIALSLSGFLLGPAAFTVGSSIYAAGIEVFRYSIAGEAFSFNKLIRHMIVAAEVSMLSKFCLGPVLAQAGNFLVGRVAAQGVINAGAVLVEKQFTGEPISLHDLATAVLVGAGGAAAGQGLRQLIGPAESFVDQIIQAGAGAAATAGATRVIVNADAGKPLHEGVLKTAGTGFIIGAVVQAGMQAYSSAEKAAQPKSPEINQTATQYAKKKDLKIIAPESGLSPGPKLPPAPRPPIIPDGPKLPPAPRPPIIPDGPKLPPVPRLAIIPDGPKLPPAPRPPVIPDGPKLPPAPRPPVIPDGPKLPPSAPKIQKDIYDLDLKIKPVQRDFSAGVPTHTCTHCTADCGSAQCGTAGATCLGTCVQCGVTAEGTCYQCG